MNQMQIDTKLEDFIIKDYDKLVKLIKKFRSVMDKAEHHTRFEFIFELDTFMDSRMKSVLSKLSERIMDMLKTDSKDVQNAPYALALQSGKELSESEAEEYLAIVRKKVKGINKQLSDYMSKPIESKEDDTMSGTKTFFENFEEDMKDLDDKVMTTRDSIMDDYSLHTTDGYGINYPFLLAIEELNGVFRDYYLCVQQFENLL